MRPAFFFFFDMNLIVRYFFIGLIAVSAVRAQSSCSLSVEKDLAVTYESRGGLATLVGFDEFVPSNPPQRYLTKTLSGTVTAGVFTDAACTVPKKSGNSTPGGSVSFTQTGEIGGIMVQWDVELYGLRYESGGWKVNFSGQSSYLSGTATSNTGLAYGVWFNAPTPAGSSLNNINFATGGSAPGYVEATKTAVVHSVNITEAQAVAGIPISAAYDAYNGEYGRQFGTLYGNPVGDVAETLTYSGASTINPATLVQTNAGSVSGELFNTSTQALAVESRHVVRR